ncbi:MAG: DNA-3-methyladenine glycosylase I [Halofilum sp. (in: g-proteobacteria)]|nr:DNA-3-methyladenine glycosylase I [Halofilum sp. (in: g-proteobacteria)]
MHDDRVRCDWCLGDADYIAYHDHEWGVPSSDDRHLFEMLILEGAQAGLSWLTILRKREGYRRAFAGFDPAVMARFDDADRARLLADTAIVRNRLKIDAAIGNARAFVDLCEAEGGFSDWLWGFVDGERIVNHWHCLDEVPAETAESRALSKALKQAGFRFVGPTICYAYMQSVGLVNDHLRDCFRHDEV